MIGIACGLLLGVTLLPFTADGQPGPGAPQISLTSSHNPTTHRQLLTLTLTLPQDATGTVAFIDEETVIYQCGAVPVQSGSAQCQTSLIKEGSRRISAIYSGDSGYLRTTAVMSTNLQVDLPETPDTVLAYRAGVVGLRAPLADPGTIRLLPGFATNALSRQDDAPSVRTDIGFTINLWGNSYAQLYVNNNGNVTFDAPMSTYTPFGLLSTSTKIIAPFFGDVDTRPANGGFTRYGADTVDGHPAFAVTWDSTGYYGNRTDKLNSFQLVIIDRSDTGPGNFDLEFNYGQMLWESGDASGGTNGLGGSPARAGFSNGSTVSQEIAGSGISGAFLDTGASALIANSNIGIPGRFLFNARAGEFIPPDLAIFSSLNPSRVGQSVTFSMTVPTGATGTVTFRDGATVLCNAVPISGGAAACATSALTLGPHTITGDYSGDSTYEAGSRDLTQTVNKPVAAVSVSSTANPSTFGQPVTFTATTTPTAGPSGMVDFTDGATVLCSNAPLVDGVATCGPLSNLSVGTHQITADYTEDDDSTHDGATSNPYAQVVNQVPSGNLNLSLSASPEIVFYGDASVLDAQLTPVLGQAGTVTFRATPTSGGSTIVLGTSSLSANLLATLPVSTLPAGTYNLVATYNGDPHVVGTATSNMVFFTVQPRPGLFVVVGDATRETTGSNPPFIYGITGPLVSGDTYATAVTGAPDFSTVYSGSTSGTYPINVTGLTSNNYTLTVVSGTLTVIIPTEPTTTVLVANPTVAEYGDSITLTATVSNTSATGTVSFYDGAALLGMASVSNGTAVLDSSSMNAGTHTIVARYSGDNFYQSSISAPAVVTINPRGTSNPSQRLTVTVQNMSRVFGAANPEFHYRVTGTLAGGDIYATAVTGVPVYTVGPPADNATSPIGSTFPITVSGLTSANYALSFVPGTLTIVGAGTVTTLTATPENTVYGQGISITATVSPAAATGTVIFHSGPKVYGAASLTGGVVSLSNVPFPAGVYHLTATYLGDSAYGSSTSDPVTVTVAKAPLTISANNTFRLFGHGNPSFGYSVTGTFYYGDTAQRAISGHAAFSTTANTASPVSPPTYPINILGGLSSDNYALTYVPGVLTIAATEATVNLTQSQPTSTYGEQVTFTATVAGVDPTGAVTFEANGVSIAGCIELAVVTNQAVCTTNSGTVAPLIVGGHSIRAVYSGDSNAGPGNSNVVNHQVANLATPSMGLLLTSGASPSPYGTAVTFTATLTVTGAPPGLPRIAFTADDVAIPGCENQLASGTPLTAVCTVSSLAVGTRSIVATFVGDANYNSATSNEVSHQVTVATPTLTLSLTSGGNPSTEGSALTFTASLPSGATGTIAFLTDGQAIPGCEAVPTATPTCTTSALSPGTHIIAAAFTSTSVNYTDATSNPLTQIVDVQPQPVPVTTTPVLILTGAMLVAMVWWLRRRVDPRLG